MKKKQEAFRW